MCLFISVVKKFYRIRIGFEIVYSFYSCKYSISYFYSKESSRYKVIYLSKDDNKIYLLEVSVFFIFENKNVIFLFSKG